MRQLIRRITGKKSPRYRRIEPVTSPRVIFTERMPETLRKCLSEQIRCRHEGIVYMYGMTDGTTTLVMGCIRPVAHTTRGSFLVSPVAMARVVRAINVMGLWLVGQIHTHPGTAYHSAGDDEGARVAYAGYVSAVVPDYGEHLPSLEGSAFYFFQSGAFLELNPSAVSVVPEFSYERAV